MTEPSFGDDRLERLRTAREVQIETRATDGARHRTTIWIVVDDQARVLIRSYRGADARWFREALSDRPSAIVVDGDTVPVTVEHAGDPDRIEACSAGLAAKYAGDPSTPAMLRDDVLGTTLQLHPA